MAVNVVKMSVNLPSADVEVLKMLAKKRRLTMTEVLRQALGTEKFIAEAQEAGSKILVEDKRGRVRELVFR